MDNLYDYTLEPQYFLAWSEFSNIKELVGTVVMEDLLKEGIIVEKPDKVFYTFKKVKV